MNLPSVPLQRLLPLWRARLVSDIAHAKNVLRDVREWPDLSSDESVQIKIVRASLLRHQGKNQICLDEIQALLSESELSAFSVCMGLIQIAICQMAKSSFSDALSSLNRAFEADPENELAVVIRLNQAICHYNLGLPLRGLLEHIRFEIGGEADHPLKKSLIQLDVMQMEQDWLRGDFDALFAATVMPLTQGAYLQALANSLPWFAPHRIAQEFVEETAGHREFYFKEHRRQTLLADARWGSSDSTDKQIQLSSDRIYLWTWKWLANPASHLSPLLANELSNFPWDHAHLTLTNMDFFFLRSAGGWLSIFNSEFARFFDAWWGKHSPPALPESLFFESDWKFSQWMRYNDGPIPLAYRAGVPAAYVQFISQLTPPLSSQPTSQPASQPASQRQMQKSGQSLFAESPAGDRLLRVDLASSTLRRGSQSMISSTLAKVISELKNEGSMSFSDALRVGFEIPHYDDWIHAPKIHNLVQRAKKILPAEAVLRTKDRRLYLEESRPVILIRCGSAHQQHFPQFLSPPNSFEKKQTLELEIKLKRKSKAFLLGLFAQQIDCTRQDIQDVLQLPKATANRYITNWLKEKWLRKTGEGRSTKYLLGARLKPMEL